MKAEREENRRVLENSQESRKEFSLAVNLFVLLAAAAADGRCNVILPNGNLLICIETKDCRSSGVKTCWVLVERIKLHHIPSREPKGNGVLLLLLQQEI